MEHIVFSTYVQAHTIWGTILVVFIYSFTGWFFGGSLLLISILFFAWTVHKYYPEKRAILRILKGITAWVMGYILLIIVASISFIVFIILTR